MAKRSHLATDLNKRFIGGVGTRETDRQTDRQRDSDRQRQRNQETERACGQIGQDYVGREAGQGKPRPWEGQV